MAAVGVATLAAGVLSVGPTATAGHAAISIQVGSILKGAPAESMRFHAPESITVHRGDRITFDFRGFHTATMLPAGVGADDWLHDNTHSPASGGYAFSQTDPDDGAGEYKDNFAAVASPTDPNCGTGDQAPCTYSGDDVLSSGAPFESGHKFTAIVDAPSGSTFWVVCLVHHHMRMRVKVVDDPASATAQTVIDQVRRQQVARDTDWARATHSKMSDRRTSHRTASGDKVWDAWAGFDSRYVSLYDFYPHNLRIGKGDTVRWRFDHLVLEDHTASLPVPKIFNRMHFDDAVCDPDGDSGTAPDTQPTFDEQTGEPTCPEGSVLEFDVSHDFWGGTGNGRYTGGRDIEHSGIRGTQARAITPPAAGEDSFDVKFTETTGKNGLLYICFLHPMEGVIKVTD
jgi:plastocyanin